MGSSEPLTPFQTSLAVPSMSTFYTPLGMSPWATFTSSFPPHQPSMITSPATPPMASIHTYDTYHQPSSLENSHKHRHLQSGDSTPRAPENAKAAFDYTKLQELVKLRESKLADCSYLTRQKTRSYRTATTTTKQGSGLCSPPVPAPRVDSTTGEALGRGQIVTQRDCSISKALTSTEDCLGRVFQGEKSANFSSSYPLKGFTSSWGKLCATDTLGGNDGLSGFQFLQVSSDDDSSDESTTDSESEYLSSWAQFTWSFPISREQRRKGVRCSDYGFDEDGRLRGLNNSPVTIILSPPSGTAPKWRPTPNDPAYPPPCKSLLHPKWIAKY